MSLALAHSLLGGVPLALLLVLVALIFTRKGPHPATYKMSDEWTHPPILWAADEPEDPRTLRSWIAPDGWGWRKWQVVMTPS